jgi:hypothetical protein
MQAIHPTRNRIQGTRHHVPSEQGKNVKNNLENTFMRIQIPSQNYGFTKIFCLFIFSTRVFEVSIMLAFSFLQNYKGDSLLGHSVKGGLCQCSQSKRW